MDAVDTPLFRYDLGATGGTVTLTADATFSAAAARFGRNRQAVAVHLQSVWDAGESLGAGFASLASVGRDAVPATLDALSGQALGLIGASRYQASLGFVDTIWSGCDPTAAVGGRCGWGRWTGTRGNMDGSRDASGYETRSNGFRIGGAQALSETLSFGAAIGEGPVVAEARPALEIAQRRRILRHVETHLLAPELSQDSLCRDFGLSRASLYRLFQPLGGVARAYSGAQAPAGPSGSERRRPAPSGPDQLEIRLFQPVSDEPRLPRPVRLCAARYRGGADDRAGRAVRRSADFLWGYPGQLGS